MNGTVSQELEVKVPASEAWKVYGTLQLGKLAPDAHPGLLSKIDVVEGDGGAGTILHLFFAPGTGYSSYKEKFVVVDDEKRVKVAEVIEGGYLDIGFTLYRVTFEVIDKEEGKSCITRSTIEYEVKVEAAANASFVSIEPLVKNMETAAHHLLLNHNTV